MRKWLTYFVVLMLLVGLFIYPLGGMIGSVIGSLASGYVIAAVFIVGLYWLERRHD